MSKAFSQVCPETNMPTNSTVVGLFVCFFWLVYFYGANLTSGWFGPFCFDSSELPIITIYAVYIPIFFSFFRDKSLSPFKRYAVPTAAILCCLFMVYAAFVAHGKSVLYYLIMSAVIMLIAVPFSKKKA